MIFRIKRSCLTFATKDKTACFIPEVAEWLEQRAIKYSLEVDDEGGLEVVIESIGCFSVYRVYYIEFVDIDEDTAMLFKLKWL